MLVLYLAGFGIFLSATFYIYSTNLPQQRSVDKNKAITKTGRDMWAATLLDCDFEPAKVRFGPAKIIPADRALHQVAHKEHFSRHMETK